MGKGGRGCGDIGEEHGGSRLSPVEMGGVTKMGVMDTGQADEIYTRVVNQETTEWWKLVFSWNVLESFLSF